MGITNKIMTLLVIALTLAPSANAEVLMSYGLNDENEKGRLNAIEMSSDSTFTDTLPRITIAIGHYPVITGIGYLNDGQTFKQVCLSNGYACQNYPRDFATARVIEFEVYNATGDTCTGLELVYHRHGKELDKLTITRGAAISTQNLGPGAEARQSEHTIPLGDLTPTDEILINIEYTGGALGNGHFIDYIGITGEC